MKLLLGRVLFNESVPEEVGFVNELLTKKKLQRIIQSVVTICGIAETAADSWMILRTLVS